MKTRLSFARFAVLAALLFVTTSARAQMSDTEKKAAARAAYQEGVKLQDEGKASEALVRFESAQKLFSAPTHLLHIAECQALTGRLVEASETYETLEEMIEANSAPLATGFLCRLCVKPLANRWNLKIHFRDKSSNV